MMMMLRIFKLKGNKHKRIMELKNNLLGKINKCNKDKWAVTHIEEICSPREAGNNHLEVHQYH